ncbi:MAG: DUF6272 family protein [Flavobacteriales bacterium]
MDHPRGSADLYQHIPIPGADMGRYWFDEARVRCFEDPLAETVFAFTGAIDHDRVTRLLGDADAAALHAGAPTPARKRLVNVLMEALENVCHHGTAQQRERSFALLVRDRSGFRFELGNAVPLVTATLLTHRVNILNEMDEADLKEHYLKLLSNDNRSAHGGAGLGLLTMARKSKRPLSARSLPLDEHTALFALGLRVDLAA